RCPVLVARDLSAAFNHAAEECLPAHEYSLSRRRSITLDQSVPHGPIGPILPVIGKYYGDLLWVSSRKLPLLRAHRRASVQPSSRRTAIETIAWSRRRARSSR